MSDHETHNHTNDSNIDLSNALETLNDPNKNNTTTSKNYLLTNFYLNQEIAPLSSDMKVVMTQCYINTSN